MEQFTEREKAAYWPQWIPDPKHPQGGQVVKDQNDHMTKFPDHYEQWLTTINPPPKSEAELTNAIVAEREACIKFVEQYPTGPILAKEIAKALRKSRSTGGGAAVVATGSMNRSNAKSQAAARDKVEKPEVETELDTVTA